MAFILKFIKGVRNHWKKSTVATVAIGYGINYTKEYYEIQQLMRVYCEKARLYGNQPIPPSEAPKKITVILNPSANKRKATKLFEKYCAPILYLAGINVDIIQTQSEGHARNLVEDIHQSDAIVIAGGDGTVAEVITGLLRLSKQSCPIGILPLGRTNTFASTLFPNDNNLKIVKSLADAAMAVVTEKMTSTNVMRVEVISQDDSKPIYGVAGLEWGAYRDANVQKDKYWFFGPLRNYVTYIFNGYKNSLNWNCTANITYSPPCTGCRNCQQLPQINNSNSTSRWWSSFMTNKVAQPNLEHTLEVNEECTKVQETKISTADLSLTVATSNPPQLKLRLGPETVSFLDFVTQGWKSEKGEMRDTRQTIGLRQLEIIPQVDNSKTSWFSIDREEYEVKPVKVTLLPQAIKVFCKENN